jgi:hypothetical protein
MITRNNIMAISLLVLKRHVKNTSGTRLNMIFFFSNNRGHQNITKMDRKMKYKGERNTWGTW